MSYVGSGHARHMAVPLDCGQGPCHTLPWQLPVQLPAQPRQPADCAPASSSPCRLQTPAAGVQVWMLQSQRQCSICTDCVFTMFPTKYLRPVSECCLSAQHSVSMERIHCSDKLSYQQCCPADVDWGQYCHLHAPPYFAGCKLDSTACMRMTVDRFVR